MALLPTVAEIRRFPVKSMQGESIDAAMCGDTGLEGDRRWAVIDRATGKVLGAKREGRLLEATATLAPGDAIPLVTLPDGSEFTADDPKASDAIGTWLDRDVSLERADPDRPMSYESNVDNTDESSAVIEFPCQPGAFFDAAVVHLVTTASLGTARNLYPAGQWDPRRFRPTLLVECEDEGWVEDGWIGGSLRIGGAELFPFAPTVRCVVTTRAQPGLDRDLEIVKTVNREHGANLGVYCAVRAPGEVRVGDPVELSSS